MSFSEFIIDTLLPLVAAATVGLTLGFERELARKPAGLRTQFLITLGTAIFVLAGRSIPGSNPQMIRPAAIIAPEFPALIIEEARPDSTRL